MRLSLAEMRFRESGLRMEIIPHANEAPEFVGDITSQVKCDVVLWFARWRTLQGDEGNRRQPAVVLSQSKISSALWYHERNRGPDRENLPR